MSAEIPVLQNLFKILTVLFAFPNIHFILMSMAYPLAGKNFHCLKVRGNSVVLQKFDSGAQFTEQENY